MTSVSSRGHAPLIEAFYRVLQDRFAFISLIIIAIYSLTAVLSALGWLPIDYVTRLGPSYANPGTDFFFGTDFLGRDVFSKVIHGAEVAFSVGMVASLIAIPIGALLGAIAGYFGGHIDEAVVWIYSTVTSIPQILLLTAITFVLGAGLTSLYIAIGLTSWIGICRLVRSEVMKHKEQDYITAAKAIGVGHGRLIFRHLLPNVFHLVIIDFSLRFIYAIKSEAILSYLGLGVQGEPSWGIMIADAKEELLRGIWWQLTFATAAMFFIVLAFNIVGDALRDVLDPRLRD